MNGRRAKVVSVLSLSLAVGLVAGCGSSSTAKTGSSTSPSTSKGKVTSTALPPASVTIAVPVLPNSADIDPKSSSDSIDSQNTAESIAGTLFTYDGSTVDPDTASAIPAPLPGLATSATPSANGLTWTLHLRPGVYSQDHDPLTSADVVWTMQRAMNAAQSGATLLGDIHANPKDPATASGPLTVELHLTSPSSLVEKVLAVSFLGILDEKAVKAHAAAGDPYGYKYLSSHSATFGPYEVGTDELPNKLVLEANPHYYLGKPQITSATFTQIADDSTRLESVLSGQVDYGLGLAAADGKSIKSSSSVTSYVQKNAILDIYGIFELGNSEVQNATVRRALSVSIDRQKIAELAYDSLATPITGCVPSGLYPYPSTPDNPADGSVTEAKKILATAPSVPKSVTVAYLSSFPQDLPTAEVIESDFNAAGVHTTLVPYSSYSTYLADQAKAKFSFGIGGIGPNVVDGGYILNATLDGSSSYDLGDFHDSTFDTAVTKALSATGGAAQADLEKACDLSLQEAPLAPLVNDEQFSGVSSKFTTLSSFGALPLLFNMRFK
jgi:peptide/nickel transport system substrate-binding protein